MQKGAIDRVVDRRHLKQELADLLSLLTGVAVTDKA
jgi:acetyl-CoA carboxylase beta subunit